jgi:thioredoxin reductase (NADPH)
VTLLVRGSTLSASMSQYLVSKVSELDNVEVRTRTEIVGLEADTRLRAVVLSSHDEAGLTRLPLESLFVCIGGEPRTRGLSTAGLATDDAGYILTGADVTASRGALDTWPLSRAPLPLEANCPGFFAAGDVRSGSIKRCSAAIGEGSMAVALVHRRLAELGAE